jgi:uncharacterized protein (DUF302 family)
MAVNARGSYVIRTKVSLPYDEAVAKTREALKEQGFGILTEIDVKKTMKEKLDVDFRRYVILGACNPRLAHRAFEAEIDIGALLPCNVIVYEEDGGSVVAAQDPEKMLGMVENPDLGPVAAEAAALIRHAIEWLAESQK